MTFEGAIRARLLADAAVAAIVGTRITWAIRPQNGALPCVVLTLASGERPETLEGYSLRRSRVQVDCWSTDALAGVGLRDAVQAALAGPWTASGHRFERVSFEGQAGSAEQAGTDFIHRQSFDARLFHTEV